MGLKARCKLDPLWGYCMESNGKEYFISFPAPCIVGEHVLAGEDVSVGCPNYIRPSDVARYNIDVVPGLIGTTKAETGKTKFGILGLSTPSWQPPESPQKKRKAKPKAKSKRRPPTTMGGMR